MFFHARLVRPGAPWRLIRLVHADTPLGSLGSFGFVLFVWMCLECRWVHASASSSCGLGVAGFARVCLVRPGAPSGSLGSLWFDLFVRVRDGGRMVDSGSSCSSGCSLGVAVVVRVRQACPDAPSWALGSFAFVSFVRLCSPDREVRRGSSGSSRCTHGVVGFFLVRLVLSVCSLAVAGFFLARLVRPGALWGSFRHVWFIKMRPGGTGFVWARSRAPQWSLGSFGFLKSLWVCSGCRRLWFVRAGPGGRWVRWGSPGCAMRVAGFIRVRLVRPVVPQGVTGFIWFRLVRSGPP